MPDIRIVINAMNKASGDLQKVKQDVKGVGDAGTQAKGGVDSFSSGIGAIMGKAALAAGAIAAVGAAVKEVYDGIKEGAELEYAASRFDRLAEAAGTTADVLLGELKEATSGMISDSELMSSASDLMALGLADTSEEVIRLTTVAGALGMNMNQLVLTLTNQTTMRFDALGVSVAGFDEKVKALTDSGMSAQDAFSEAFLQQAEAQIEKVGSIADTSAGKIRTMESAFKNLGDAIKLTMADALDGLAPAMANLADGMTENVRIGQQWETVIGQLKAAKDNDLISGREYNELLRDIGIHSGMGAVTAEQLAIAQHALNEIIGDGADEFYNLAPSIETARIELASAIAAAEAAAPAQRDAAAAAALASGAYDEYGKILGLTEEQLKAVIDEQKRLAKIQEEISKVTSLTGYFSDMVSLGENFTDILAEITKQEQIMAENPIGSEKYEEAKGKVEELKVAMQDLANQVVLDMMMSTIAIGGVTQAEADAYFQLAADMGTISQEAAEAAKTAYGDAIEYINSLEIDDKTGNIVFKVDDTEVRNYRPPTVRGTVAYIPAYATTQAVGGAVNAGEPYTWQEYGYRGELFVPSMDGYILSRADAARAVSAGSANIDYGQLEMAVESAFNRALDRYDNKLRPTAVMSRASAFENTARWR